ncbi:unnamed protein product [Rangifer tarandus platyrhynchus]|uniref:Uncharacterized protein n=1 Tax=Rangifer tarandus platyrhynchus TaxID=3082113 RepID=A0AC59Z3Y6_RANTA
MGSRPTQREAGAPSLRPAPRLGSHCPLAWRGCRHIPGPSVSRASRQLLPASTAPRVGVPLPDAPPDAARPWLSGRISTEGKSARACGFLWIGVLSVASPQEGRGHLSRTLTERLALPPRGPVRIWVLSQAQVVTKPRAQPRCVRAASHALSAAHVVVYRMGLDSWNHQEDEEMQPRMSWLQALPGRHPRAQRRLLEDGGDVAGEREPRSFGQAGSGLPSSLPVLGRLGILVATRPRCHRERQSNMEEVCRGRVN